VVRKAMSAIPMPIVMAMVAAIFLRFGLDIVDASRTDPWVAVPMVVAFVVLSASPRLARMAPPILGALIVGLVAVLVSGRLGLDSGGAVFATPVFTAPEFTLAAQVELVIPLALTVLVVQNGSRPISSKSAAAPPRWTWVPHVRCGRRSAIRSSSIWTPT